MHVPPFSFSYSPDFDHVACCIRIPLERIDRIVVGKLCVHSILKYFCIHFDESM